MTFGEKLRNLRQSRFMSQQKLADAIGLSQAAIASYETGVREPAFSVIEKFANYFHVPFSSLTPSNIESDDDFLIRLSESLQTNPKLKDLFKISMTLDNDKIDTLLVVAKSLDIKAE